MLVGIIAKKPEIVREYNLVFNDSLDEDQFWEGKNDTYLFGLNIFPYKNYEYIIGLEIDNTTDSLSHIDKVGKDISILLEHTKFADNEIRLWAW